ncbi:MAG: nucleotidyltransferase family protein [Candidatus Micrarchaeota archaeon]
MNLPEEKLLLNLIKGGTGKKDYDVNWSEFIELCAYHKISPLILEKINRQLMPKKELQKLRNSCKKTVLLNMILNKELFSLKKETEKKGIEFIAIKGTALNNLLYSKTFSRVSSDIDLLIKEKDYREIRKILEKKGFKSDSFGLWKNNLFAQHYPGIRKEINGFTCLIELHKKIVFPVNCFSVDLKEIWKDSQELNGMKIPGNEDIIIIAVLSSVYQHCFQGIFREINDVQKLLEKIDEKKLEEKAEKYSVLEPLIYFNELMEKVSGKKIKGIKELEKKADKKKMKYLRKNSLEKILEKKSPLKLKIEIIKTRFYWTKNLRQKIKVLFFAVVFPLMWKIRFLLTGKY